MSSLSWTSGKSNGSMKDFNFSDILDKLSFLKKSCGTVTLRSYKNDEEFMLQVRAENDNYLVTLGGVFDGDYDVMSYDGSGDGSIMILGDLWPEAQVSKDFNFVKSVFKIFYKTGRVSKGMLN